MTASSPVPETGLSAPPDAGSDLASDLLALAERAARAAGVELVARAGTPQKVSTKSTPTDLVSEADRVAEAVILDMLQDARPDDGHVGEEGARRESRSGITWVVDPLDGTVNYLFGDREWSVSIAAVDADGPLVAAVLEPSSGRIWTAARGRGAWCGETLLAARRTPELADAMVLAGLSYDATERRGQMQMFTEVVGSVRDLRRHGSAALELCRVAEGAADAYIESPIYRWDIDAGTLIAREAGALVHVDEVDEVRRSVVAATPGILNELMAVVRSSSFGSERFDYLDVAR